jgi:hypothetical protein
MKKRIVMRFFALIAALTLLLALPAFAAGTGDVSGAVESTWTTAAGQLKTIVNNVVFPALDAILAVFFFVKVGTAYFDYRKHGQFEWAPPAILLACLIFTLTAPAYIWGIVGL